ncbi:30S ribosomal protein S24e [Methanoculleus sp. FWC-SCC1]|uniref:Small ribosomal subunit protein eS24 n=1 Tax=Methanoculleus frigidifontis TaxID=2584085 RepID=A0ABT8MAT0_9EURY|nr:30S ribosomal protein S24e [Methanoculleus sp. FWC-SCC1]MDN7025054.1 30S ribosomal protein S24e [Methanoculleus sp. FWC-SCC1]
MDFAFTRDERNKLLNRREVAFTLTFEGATPSRQNIQSKIAALLNQKEDLVVLDSLKTSFGKMEVTGVARIYDDEESKQRTEREYLVKRGKAAEESEA